MLILMQPSEWQLRRMLSAGRLEPRWFGTPILPARFSRRLSDLLLALFRNEPILVFNIGALEAILALLPLWGRRICCLHQWLPLDALPLWKRLIYGRLLLSSRLILTYSEKDRESLRIDYPAAECEWIGHFVDTDFFDPNAASVAEGNPYYLCAGDHKRLEDIVSGISNRLGVRIIRLSTRPEIADYHRENSPNVECLTGVSFDRVRNLYAGASLVLNAVDDAWFPVGITTFCEALAMGRPVITSGGHSCSGYGSQNTIGLEKIQDIRSLEAWVGAIEKVERERDGFDDISLRAIALGKCSLDSMRAMWEDVKGRLGE